MHLVKPGDYVRPVALWNRSERYPRQLTSTVEVLGVAQGLSESGVLFLVQHKSGARSWLDAAWFEVDAIGVPHG